MLKKTYTIIFITAIVLAGCNPKTNDVKIAADSITIEQLKNRISVLASDEF